MENKLLWFSLFLVVVMGADFLSTRYALGNGAHEGNPIMASIVDSTFAFLLIKIIGTIAIIVSMAWCLKKDEKIAQYGMKIIGVMMLFVLANNFMVVIGNAESGTIIISDDKTFDYTSAVGLTSGIYQNFSSIDFNTANYNYLSSFHVKASYGATFGHGFESTSFTFNRGATGSGGTAWYDANTTNIYFSFNPDDRITANDQAYGGEVVLNFAHNIFANVTIDSTHKSDDIPTVNAPVQLMTYTPVQGRKALAGIYGSVQAAIRTQDSYIVDYPMPNYFRVNVTKNQDIATKYIIKGMGSGSYYSNETTFNKNNIDGAIFVYNDGIVLNTTTLGGAYTLTIVNSTIANQAVTAGNITWNQSSYEIGQIGMNFSLNISNPDYDNYIYGVQTLDPWGNIVETGILPTGTTTFISQTETPFTQGGIYELQLYSCGYGLCNINKYVFATDTAIVFGGAFNSTLSYSNLTLKSRYPIYYNNSKFTIDFGIAYQALWNQTTQYSHRIDLIDPNSVPISSFSPIRICEPHGTVLGSETAYDIAYPDHLYNCIGVSKTLDINDFINDPAAALQSATSISFSPSTFWTNGTYKVKLYEINALSGTPTVLLTDSFNVLNQSGVMVPGGTGSNQGQNPNEPIDGSGIITLLQNNTFWAFLLTIGVMIAVGIPASKNGGSPFMPMAMAGFLGLGVTTMIGWMPIWIIGGTILIVIVAFSWQQATKTNTGSQ
jgi:hypothetical protein